MDGLFLTYVLIAALVLVLAVREMFHEREWRNQLALALIVIPLLLRILHIK
jgi:hypothetical protein